MKHVFATETRVVSHPTSGIGIPVNIGEHWPAEDPVVKAYPALFTGDPRYGLRSSLPLGDDGLPVTSSQSAPAKKAAAKKVSKGRGARRSRAAATETATAAPGEQRSRTEAKEEPVEKAPPADAKPDAKTGETVDEKATGAK